MKPTSKQRGVTLIEVLVALLILSVGLLGLARLQTVGIQQNHGAWLRSQGTNFAYDITDRMRANRESALDGDYDIAEQALTCNPVLAPTGSVAARDLAEWRNEIACALPDGRGFIEGAGNRFTVTIRWNDSRGQGGALQTLIVETEL